MTPVTREWRRRRGRRTIKDIVKGSPVTHCDMCVQFYRAPCLLANVPRHSCHVYGASRVPRDKPPCLSEFIFSLTRTRRATAVLLSTHSP
jgi:hypothetical protein